MIIIKKKIIYPSVQYNCINSRPLNRQPQPIATNTTRSHSLSECKDPNAVPLPSQKREEAERYGRSETIQEEGTRWLRFIVHVPADLWRPNHPQLRQWRGSKRGVSGRGISRVYYTGRPILLVRMAVSKTRSSLRPRKRRVSRMEPILRATKNRRLEEVSLVSGRITQRLMGSYGGLVNLVEWLSELLIRYTYSNEERQKKIENGNSWKVKERRNATDDAASGIQRGDGCRLFRR